MHDEASLQASLDTANERLNEISRELEEVRRVVVTGTVVTRLSQDEELMAKVRDVETRIKAGEVFEGVPASDIPIEREKWIQGRDQTD